MAHEIVGTRLIYYARNGVTRRTTARECCWSRLNKEQNIFDMQVKWMTKSNQTWTTSQGPISRPWGEMSRDLNKHYAQEGLIS